MFFRADDLAKEVKTGLGMGLLTDLEERRRIRLRQQPEDSAG